MNPKGTISFLITTACQNRCLFCFERGSARTASLSADFVLQRVQERKPRSVDLAGGEPLVHPEFAAMAEGIETLGAGLTVTTNGLALADEGLARFLARTADRIVLSVHAGNAHDYEAVTANPEGFALLEQAIDNLAQFVPPGRVLINSTVTARTWCGISQVPRLVAPLRPLAWHVTNPMPIGAAAKNYEALVPRIETVRAGIEDLVRAAQEQSLDVFFGFFPACALGPYRHLNSDLAEPAQASGFPVDRDLNPHQTENLTFERTFAAPCRACALASDRCAGPAAEYLRLFGPKELVPETGPRRKGEGG